MRKFPAILPSALGLALTLIAIPAHADRVEPTGKAIAGGALLGTELAVISGAIAGVRSPWLYASGIALVGGGGGVGGYYIEKSGNVGLSMTMLFAGMALIIPTAIVYLDATGDEPPEAEPPPQTDPTIPEFGGPSARYRAAEYRASMIELAPDRLSVRVLPPLEVREVYTREELHDFGLTQRVEFEFALFGAQF